MVPVNYSKQLAAAATAVADAELFVRPAFVAILLMSILSASYAAPVEPLVVEPLALAVQFVQPKESVVPVEN